MSDHFSERDAETAQCKRVTATSTTGDDAGAGPLSKRNDHACNGSKRDNYPRDKDKREGVHITDSKLDAAVRQDPGRDGRPADGRPADGHPADGHTAGRYQADGRRADDHQAGDRQAGDRRAGDAARDGLRREDSGRGDSVLEQKKVRILLVDDSAPLRAAVRQLVEDQPGWVICGEAENGADGVEKAEQLLPDVVLMDVTMPVMNGLEATRRIAIRVPSARVLILSQHQLHGNFDREEFQGASGYVMKSEASFALAPAIRKVLADETFFTDGGTLRAGE